MKVVILCGGMGIRFKGFIDDVPKPLISIGDIPILIHVMDHFASFEYTDYLLCLGYRKDDFIKYFLEKIIVTERIVTYQERLVSVSFLRNGRMWKINLLDTGEETNTGGRIKEALAHISSINFYLTYADGLTTLNLNHLFDFHKYHGKPATVTIAKVRYQYGVVKTNEENKVVDFQEKPFLDIWANIGFFILQTNYMRSVIELNDVFENQTIKRITESENLYGYKFSGFWRGMDTYKDYLELNEEWSGGDAVWLRGNR